MLEGGNLVTILHVPALRGADALGFLAALGIASLADQELISPCRIGWTPGAAPTLVMEGYESIPDLAHELTSAFAVLREAGSVGGGLPANFPVPKQGGKDPMRMAFDEMQTWYAYAQRQWLLGETRFAWWLTGMAGQTAVKDDQRGDITLTPFYAPTGQMAMRTSIFDKTVEAVEKVSGPADAVGNWRRVSYDGANFDDRAKRDAGLMTTGKSDNQGAPSATWLAAMAMTFFTMVDHGRSTDAVGWQRAWLYPGFTTRTLIWPVWSELLDPSAVRVLIAHPSLEVKRNRRALPTIPASAANRLRGLGVAGVFGASRRTLSQGDGPLGPAVRIWPSGNQDDQSATHRSSPADAPALP